MATKNKINNILATGTTTGTATTLNNTLNTIYTTPNSGSGLYTTNGGWTVSTTDTYYNTFNFEEKVLDLEKLTKLDNVKREMIMELFLSFTKCEDYNTKKLIYNTLEVYNVITDQKALIRKMKISKITDNEENIK